MINATEAHEQAMGLPLSVAVEQLVELIGATTVAAIGGVQETRAVQQWQTGEREPQRPHVLRFALQLALMVQDSASRGLVRAWFHGSNPALGDRPPVAVLRDESLETIQVSLMRAVRSFAGRPPT